MNIFLSNLNFKVNSNDLKNLFEQYGEVLSPCVIIDKESGKSKGFDFVEMENDGNGLNAIADLHGKVYENRIMKVVIAKEKKKKIISIRYCLPPKEYERLETLRRHRSFRHL